MGKKRSKKGSSSREKASGGVPKSLPITSKQTRHRVKMSPQLSDDDQAELIEFELEQKQTKPKKVSFGLS